MNLTWNIHGLTPASPLPVPHKGTSGVGTSLPSGATPRWQSRQTKDPSWSPLDKRTLGEYPKCFVSRNSVRPRVLWPRDQTVPSESSCPSVHLRKGVDGTGGTEGPFRGHSLLTPVVVVVLPILFPESLLKVNSVSSHFLYENFRLTPTPSTPRKVIKFTWDLEILRSVIIMTVVIHRFKSLKTVSVVWVHWWYG